jgi:hypothetical protein
MPYDPKTLPSFYNVLIPGKLYKINSNRGLPPILYVWTNNTLKHTYYLGPPNPLFFYGKKLICIGDMEELSYVLFLTNEQKIAINITDAWMLSPAQS